MDGSLSQKVTYGFNREPKIRNFLYSFLISSLYFFGIGIPVLFGYMMKIARRISEGQNKTTPPSYEPLKPLIIDGFVVLVYAIILIGLPSFGVISTETLVQENITQGSLSTTDAAILNGLVLGLFILMIGGTFLFPAMLFAFLISGEWYYGFELRLTGKILYRRSYIALYIKFIFISFLVGFLSRILFIPVITAPLSIILWFVYITLIGQMFGYEILELKEKDLDNL